MDSKVVMAVANNGDDAEAVQCNHTSPREAPEPNRTVRVVRDRNTLYAVMHEWSVRDVVYPLGFEPPEWWPTSDELASNAR